MCEKYSHQIRFKEGTANSGQHRNTISPVGGRKERGKKRKGWLKGKGEVVREKGIKRERG